jgi:hypothetical protein
MAQGAPRLTPPARAPDADARSSGVDCPAPTVRPRLSAVDGARNLRQQDSARIAVRAPPGRGGSVGRAAGALAVPSHDLGDSLLIGGRPPSAVCGR